MHFLDKRVNVICDELKKLQWKQKFPVTDWKYKEGYEFCIDAFLHIFIHKVTS